MKYRKDKEQLHHLKLADKKILLYILDFMNKILTINTINKHNCSRKLISYLINLTN